MATINDSKVSAWGAESAETAEKSALETIADANGAFKLFTDEVSASADTSNDNLESGNQIVHDPSMEASGEAENGNQASIGESGEFSLTDRSMQHSPTAPSTESESESQEDSLSFPLAINSLTFPLSIIAWFSKLCSKKSFMSSTKAQAPKEFVVNPNAANEDLADSAKFQAPEELEVSTNSIEPDASEKFEGSGKAVENAMKEYLDVSTSVIGQDDLADADNQIDDTDEAIENPLKESLDVRTDAIVQDEGAEENMIEALNHQVGRMEDSVGKYKRAIKSPVSTVEEDSLGEAKSASESDMNGPEEDANAVKSQASTVEASVGEATAVYGSRVEALKIKFESFRI